MHGLCLIVPELFVIDIKVHKCIFLFHSSMDGLYSVQEESNDQSHVVL